MNQGTKLVLKYWYNVPQRYEYGFDESLLLPHVRKELKESMGLCHTCPQNHWYKNGLSKFWFLLLIKNVPQNLTCGFFGCLFEQIKEEKMSMIVVILVFNTMGLVWFVLKPIKGKVWGQWGVHRTMSFVTLVFIYL